MKHSGTKKIETTRLILREISLADAKFMIKNWVSDSEVTRYLTWNAYKDINKAMEFANYCIEANKSIESYKWVIEFKQNGEAIGTIDVVAHSNKQCKAEVGYVLSRKFWGIGLMTEALAAVISYLFKNTGFNRIQAAHHIENLASGKVMKKCGMRFEGVQRQAIKDNDGKFCDVATYAIVRDDWDYSTK